MIQKGKEERCNLGRGAVYGRKRERKEREKGEG
jgi:hypothetical protein